MIHLSKNLGGVQFHTLSTKVHFIFNLISHFYKFARRSKRDYMLLDLPLLDLHALGSKRAYTPRDIVDQTLITKSPFTQYIQSNNLKIALDNMFC